MKVNLVVFAGRQEIKDSDIAKQLKKEFTAFLQVNKERIETLFYWAGTLGTMWLIVQVAQEVGIPVTAYSIERTRRNDETSNIHMECFADDDERIKEFAKNGDVFVALPWGKGTIKEVFAVSDMILENNEEKIIYIPAFFTAFFTLMQHLEDAEMLYPDDSKILQKVEDLSDIKI